MSKLISAAASLLAAAVLLSQTLSTPDPFLEKPYLQLGDRPALSSSESLTLIWHTENVREKWEVEVRTSRDSAWRSAGAVESQVVSAPAGEPAIAGKNGAKKDAPASPAIAPHIVYRARLTNLVPGEEFHYRVLKAGTRVFDATARARKSNGQAFRFALFGDCGQGTPSENAIAYQAYLAKPDFIFIPGDIVYGSGRISEYRTKFFPNYNADEPSSANGAPLLRSVPFIAAPGNHDTALANYQRFPDALAYFLYWDQPLNGPVAPPGAAKAAHTLTGSNDAQATFLAGAGARYPRMANFSFDYGNTHWTVLDANTYMDWGNASLREWLTKDLAAAQSATWRFVAFHQPGFNSSKEHFTEQQMRVLAPIFEAGHVDIVFSGHVHNYQRSFPLTFAPAAQPDGSPAGPKGEIAGEWKLDKTFGDGAKSKPHGVIYIVSGAGGAELYNPEQQTDPASWQSFTDKFISTVHSLSVVDIEGKTFRLKQVSETGDTVDSFQVSK
ncbi:MAG TPA: metallophosphoesterase [Bryobacteraceae bacterium]|nr:metallophosphoesterase [Bryobacteraceae bacterium]